MLLSGCQSIAYYSQAVGGHLSILNQQKSIEKLLLDEHISRDTRARLRQVLQVREFAAARLHLPDNRSYTRYVDLGRDYAVWNVVATPRYSVEPRESCFWVVGCLSYRGYYDKADAIKHAQQLKDQGLDTHVGGVTAYSTLGWMADPVLNTMLARSEVAMAGLIFHELAHQQIYIKGDTKFNESFATAVEKMGLKQWAAARDQSEEMSAYFAEKEKRQLVVKLILDTRIRMQAAYRAEKNEQNLENIKQAQFKQLRDDYRKLKRTRGGTLGFDRFFAADLNHASLALFGEYHGWVAAFEQLFKLHHGDWPNFYQAAAVLGSEDNDARRQSLRALE